MIKIAGGILIAIVALKAITLGMDVIRDTHLSFAMTMGILCGAICVWHLVIVPIWELMD